MLAESEQTPRPIPTKFARFLPDLGRLRPTSSNIRQYPKLAEISTSTKPSMFEFGQRCECGQQSHCSDSTKMAEHDRPLPILTPGFGQILTIFAQHGSHSTNMDRVPQLASFEEIWPMFTETNMIVGMMSVRAARTRSKIARIRRKLSEFDQEFANSPPG